MAVQKKNRKRVSGFGIFFILALLVVATPAHAEIGMGATVKGGTLGVGFDLTYPIIDEFLNVRLGYNNLSFIKHGQEISGVNYNIETDFNNVPLLLDVHPFRGEFRLTGGLYYLKNEFDMTAIPGTDIKIGDTVVSAADVGQINGDIQFGSDWAHLDIFENHFRHFGKLLTLKTLVVI